MIAYLPTIYPDELVYSWFCRYYVHSGSLNHKMALNDLFCKRSDSLSKEFIGNLNPEARERIEKVVLMESLVLKHTMFSQYARFIPNKAETLEFLIKNSTVDIHNIFSVLLRENNDSFLKYCPVCVKTDRGQYGETYWHRLHQIRGMSVCTKHGCLLYPSAVPAKSYNSFSFQPAEFNVDVESEIIIANEDLLDYYSYIADVFDALIDFDNEIPISAVLYKTMKNKGYIKGKQRKIKQLSEDLCSFFKELSVPNVATSNQVRRVLYGTYSEFSAICQLAYFFGIPAYELISPKLAPEEIYEGSHHQKVVKRDWIAIDEELAPAFKRFSCKIYNSIGEDGRPGRVTKKMVCKEFCIHEESFQKLPKCKKILEAYTETQEEYWAREIIWAYKRLIEKGQTFYWSDVRRLTGIKKCNLDRVLPFLADYPEIVEFLSV